MIIGKLMNIMFGVLFWMGVYAYYKAKKNGTSFTEEYRIAFNTLKNLIFGLFHRENNVKEVKAKSSAKSDADNARMSALATAKNHQVQQMINYRYPANHGWKYAVDNWTYLLTHDLPVKVEIMVTSSQHIDATVVTKGGVVCDVVSRHSASPSSAPVPASSTSAKEPKEVKTSPAEKPEENHEKSVEKPEKSKPASSPTSTQPSEADIKKAASVALNYVIDNTELLNKMANDAVSEGKKMFLVSDLPGDKLTWEKIIEELEKINFINCKMVGEGTVEVGVNLNAPADDGNFDFEKSEDDEDVSFVSDVAEENVLTDEDFMQFN